ncbi:hypothetical protein F7C95_01880 [Opitutia bacterium ISCC 51]|nr:hypothetical protein F7C95_01880 [Opitutae bacterium ISCC 51]QXD28751.1 hypothetical protein GA003_01870 [Opitutae bacterium ISCC 52]
MPLIRSIITLLALTCSVGFASIDYLEQRYYSEESFTRISEYFNGVEVAGNRTILRSDSEARTGHYVTFQLSTSDAVDHFKLEVYEPGSPDLKEYIFQASSSIEPSKPIYLGLTGEKWADKTHPPVAYKLSVIGKDGTTLDSASSFLWGDD